MNHIPVLLHEAIQGLALAPGDIVLDGTLGSAGHTAEILKQFGSRVRVIGLDLDADAIARSTERLNAFGDKDVTFIEENFRNLDIALANLQVTHVNKILLDLGWSTDQFAQSGRGFSFQQDEPLRMTFRRTTQEGDLDARTIINEWSEQTLQTIIERYGEERFARRIAKKIVDSRALAPIETTAELVAIILEATPARYHHGPLHPATRTFQALRIAVNDELQALQGGLQKGIEHLAPAGRMAVITFHSLEDRIVKHFFIQQQKDGVGTILTKKPIIASEAELAENRRARSAKLRIIQKN